MKGGKGSEEIRNLGRDVCETYSKDSWKIVDSCKGASLHLFSSSPELFSSTAGFWESSKMDTADRQDEGPTPSVFDGDSSPPPPLHPNQSLTFSNKTSCDALGNMH